jgi:hypothetical protein
MSVLDLSHVRFAEKVGSCAVGPCLKVVQSAVFVGCERLGTFWRLAGLSNFSHRRRLLRKLLPVRLRLIGGLAGVLIGVTLRPDRDALQKSVGARAL